MPVRGRDALSVLATTLYRELRIGLLVGLPALGLVLATNRTASSGLIALHAALLGALAPLLVALLSLTVPRPARPGTTAVLRELGVRTVALGGATAAMILVLTTVTPLSLRVLVGGPLLVGLAPVFLAYALVGLGVEWSDMRALALRAEAEEARARQAALTARIRPHFLFNALNCIEELTDTDPSAAREAVGRLSRLLRAVLTSSSAPLGSLDREARLVDDYLGIERLRFGPRFTYALRVGPEAAERRVPGTVLLTLAENAVKHGVEQVPGPVHVELEARVEPDGRLRLVLSGPAAPARVGVDKGCGSYGAADEPEPWPLCSRRARLGKPEGCMEAGARAKRHRSKGAAPVDKGGYGLADVRERLALAYGGRASFVFARDQEGKSHVELIVPE